MVPDQLRYQLSAFMRSCSPVKATNSAVTDIVGAGNIRQYLTRLTTSDGFLPLMPN